MFGKKKKSQEKLTLQEYQKLKESREKRLFRFQPYPWQVNFALGLPFVVLVMLFLIYFFHIRGVIG
jgi:hypothetical protein